MISEAVIHEILQLNDAEGIVYLPNEEIFTGLAQMGYEKPYTKLTFYKAFYSSQWKFLIHTIIQSLSAKQTSWNEFSTVMASVMICLSKGQKFNFSKYIFNSLVRNVDNSSKFYMYPRFIQLSIQNQVGDLSTHTTRFISPALTQKVFANMRRVGKGFSGVETPLFEAHVAEDVSPDAIPSPPPHVIPSPSQEPSSPPQQQQSSLKLHYRMHNFQHSFNRVKKLEKANKIKSSKLRRLRKVGTSRRVESSDDMEDEDDSEVHEVVEVVTTAKLITEVVTAAASQVSAASTTIPAASATILAAKPSIPVAAPTSVAAYTRKRNGVIIRDPEEELPLKTPAETQKEEIDRDHDGFNKDIDWDAAMD
nr:hypothetical protein [Tanacetum cinerariifolium]